MPAEFKHGPAGPADLTSQGPAVQALHREFPIASHPMPAWVHDAGRHTADWLRRMRLVQSTAAVEHFTATRTERFAARTHPEAPADRGDILADWYTWLFNVLDDRFDDQFDEGRIGSNPAHVKAIVDAIVAVIDGRPPSGSLALAWGELQARICAFEPPAPWTERFLAHVREYLYGCLWEARYRTQSRVPAPADYPLVHGASRAIIPSFDLIEFATDTYLPEPIYAWTTYRITVDAASQVVVYSNDLASLPREHARGEVFNHVMLLVHNHGYSWPEAVATVRRLLDAQMDVFFAGEAALRTWPDCTELEPNLRGLRHWLRGNLDWSVETSRYLAPR
ncbi:terpene synthase family protein [Streptomyces sp. NPDC001107]